MTAATTRREFTPDDLVAAATLGCEALAPALDADWRVLARDLEWSCHRTLQHMAEAPLLHATHLVTRATERRPSFRAGDAPPPVADLLRVIPANALILATIARATPAEARGWHPTGMADASGFAAISSVEMLIHTADIAAALGLPYEPPGDLAGRILRRLCPWAPPGSDDWTTLQWAAGRAALPGHERLGPDWSWQSGPLAEWDGTMKKRRT